MKFDELFESVLLAEYNNPQPPKKPGLLKTIAKGAGAVARGAGKLAKSAVKGAAAVTKGAIKGAATVAAAPILVPLAVSNKAEQLAGKLRSLGSGDKNLKLGTYKKSTPTTSLPVRRQVGYKRRIR